VYNNWSYQIPLFERKPQEIILQQSVEKLGLLVRALSEDVWLLVESEEKILATKVCVKYRLVENVGTYKL
jgi:hypothetical protein